MKATALGRLLAALVATLFAIGFAIGSLAPALAGVALLAFMDGARRTVRVQGVQASREAPPIGAIGARFTSTVTAHVGSGAPLRIEAPAPEGIVLLDETVTLGREARLVQTMEPTAPGRHTFPPVHVDVEDRWGLWAFRIPVEAGGAIGVAPEGKFLERGRRTGRRHTVQKSVKDPQTAEKLPEVQTVRPYDTADRARDIDWGVSTRLGELHVRDRERAAPRKYVIFLDATRSMRRPGRVPKLRTASRVAMGIAGAAHGAGVHASLLAFHEEGVVTAGDAQRRAAIPELLDRLARLPSVEGVDEVKLTTDLDRVPTSAERDFLHAVSPLVGSGSGAPTLDAALGALTHVSGAKAFIVAIMDGEVNPRRVEVAVRRLKRIGHDVAVVIPATGPHHVDKRSALPILEDLEEALHRRKRLIHTLAAMKVPCHVVRPGEEEDIVLEVARSAV